MKKTFLPLFLSAIISSCQPGPDPVPTPPVQKQDGVLLDSISQSFEYTAGGVMQKDSFISWLNYDAMNRVTSIWGKDPRNNVAEFRQTFFYNGSAMLPYLVHAKDEMDNSITERKFVFYNSQNKIAKDSIREIRKSFPDSTVTVRQFSYDSPGITVITFSTYRLPGNILERRGIDSMFYTGNNIARYVEYIAAAPNLNTYDKTYEYKGLRYDDKKGPLTYVNIRPLLADMGSDYFESFSENNSLQSSYAEYYGPTTVNTINTDLISYTSKNLPVVIKRSVAGSFGERINYRFVYK